MIRIWDGRSDFPVEPTRALDRIGRRCPGSGDACDSPRGGPPVTGVAGQGARHRLASGRTGYADLVAWRTQHRTRHCASNVAMRLKSRSANELPVPAALIWRGIDGVPTAEPLAATEASCAWSQGNRLGAAAPCRHVSVRPAAARRWSGATVFGAGADRRGERETVAVDRDEVFLIEDWRLRADGTAIAPGIDPKDPRRRFTPSTGARCWIFQFAPMSACDFALSTAFNAMLLL